MAGSSVMGFQSIKSHICAFTFFARLSWVRALSDFCDDLYIWVIVHHCLPLGDIRCFESFVVTRWQHHSQCKFVICDWFWLSGVVTRWVVAVFQEYGGICGLVWWWVNWWRLRCSFYGWNHHKCPSSGLQLSMVLILLFVIFSRIVVIFFTGLTTGNALHLVFLSFIL